MMFGLFRFDWTILIVLPALIFSIYAQVKVSSTYKQYEKTYTQKRITGAEAARRILDSNGLGHIRIEHVRGHLTDHFDPQNNVIRLSDSVYASTSAAAVGVAAHEAGHAVQHATGYFPIKVRSAAIPATKIGSWFAIPLFFIGLMFASDYLMLAGIALYSCIAFFQLVTLPVEFNASARAMKVLKTSGMLNSDEQYAARQVLTAAAMTYVAALLTSLLTLLRLLVLMGGRSNRK